MYFRYPYQKYMNDIIFNLIYRPPMRVEHIGEVIYGCRSHNAKVFQRIEHSGIR